MGCPRGVADHIHCTDRGGIVEHAPPGTFFKEAKDPRIREFLSQMLGALPLLLRGWIGRVGAKHYRPPAREGSLRHAAITSQPPRAPTPRAPRALLRHPSGNPPCRRPRPCGGDRLEGRPARPPGAAYRHLPLRHRADRKTVATEKR